jgi:cystathionine beta-lyase
LLEPGAQHRPLACIDPDFAERTITLMAPSKTWNLAGLGCAVAVIPDAALRRRFQRAMAGFVPHPNLLGYVAAEAAYRHGERWRRDLIEYLGHNRRLLADWLEGSERLACGLPEATYLAWIDARAIDAENPLPAFESLDVGLSDGRDFGAPGFVRLNFGCRRAVLEEALRRLRPLW